MINPQKLAQMMAEKPDLELFDMFTSADDWTAEALACAKAELRNRGLDPDRRPPPKMPDPALDAPFIPKQEEQTAREYNYWESKVIWLPAGHPANPFSQEVLDCRAVALSFSCWTSDKSVAESFNRLRASDGSDARGRLPEQAIVIECALRFPYSGQHNDGPVFRAREMEDKWDFYTYDNRLYVRRSWSGLLTHVAELEYSSDAVVVRRIHCETSTVYGDRDFAIAQMEFMISTHMGRVLMPFPIPPDPPLKQAKEIALAGFNAYGRRAQFASYLRQKGNEA